MHSCLLLLLSFQCVCWCIYATDEKKEPEYKGRGKKLRGRLILLKCGLHMPKIVGSTGKIKKYIAPFSSLPSLPLKVLSCRDICRLSDEWNETGKYFCGFVFLPQKGCVVFTLIFWADMDPSRRALFQFLSFKICMLVHLPNLTSYAWPTLSQFWSLEILPTTFWNYIKFVDPWILRLFNWERARQVTWIYIVQTRIKRFVRNTALDLIMYFNGSFQNYEICKRMTFASIMIAIFWQYLCLQFQFRRYHCGSIEITINDGARMINIPLFPRQASRHSPIYNISRSSTYT